MLAPWPSVPAAAATEGREAHTTYRTRLSNYARRETSNACGEECDEPLQLKPRTTLSTMVVISSLQLLLLPLQRARRRRGRLQAHQLRLPDAGWAPRRRPAAAVAQLQRGASERQHEGFCTREHSCEHGSGSASGHAGQGARGAPFGAALLVLRRSRFASACEKRNREAKQIQTRTSFLEIVGPGARQRRSAQINDGTGNEDASTRYTPLKRSSPTPLHFPLA